MLAGERLPRPGQIFIIAPSFPPSDEQSKAAGMQSQSWLLLLSAPTRRRQLQEASLIFALRARDKGRLFPPVYKSVNEKWKEGEFSLEGNLSTHKAEERATVRETVGPCLSALNMPYNLHITDRGHFEGCHRRQTFCLQTSCSHRVDFCEGLGD